MKTMNDLFLHFLQDIYYAEKAFAKTSGKIMKAVQNEEVREILKKAKDHAQEPIEALDRVFEAVDFADPDLPASMASNVALQAVRGNVELGSREAVVNVARGGPSPLSRSAAPLIAVVSIPAGAGSSLS